MRYDTMEKIIFSGRKLLQRTQTCPIGMISLFLVSYSALWIISSTKDSTEHSMNLSSRSVDLSARSNLSYRANESKEIFRLGGGLQHRLEKTTLDCLEALNQLSTNIKCLGILCDCLRLKYSCFLGKKHVKFTPEYFEEVIYTTEYQQFAFGSLFWHIERIRYYEEFHKHDQHLFDRTYSGMTGGIDILLQKYHIPDNHSILHQERYFRVQNFKLSNEILNSHSQQINSREYGSDSNDSTTNEYSDHVIEFSQPFSKIIT